MEQQDREQAERPIRTAFEAGDYELAATRTIELYGQEMLGFLAAQLRNQDAAADIFADFCEQFWSTLSRFEWRCSMRTPCATSPRRSRTPARRPHTRTRHTSWQ